jgi:hypothetical protein
VTQTGWPTEDGIYELRSPTGVELWAFYRGEWRAIDSERPMSTDTLREMEYRAVRVTMPLKENTQLAVDALERLAFAALRRDVSADEVLLLESRERLMTSVAEAYAIIRRLKWGGETNSVSGKGTPTTKPGDAESPRGG